MGGGGSMLAMVQSVRNNRELRKKRKGIKSRLEEL